MDVLGLGIQLCKRAKQLFLGLLDSYSGAAAAYSLRKLSRGYSGPIVRVRRDGDADGTTNERDFTSTTQIADWVNGKLETTLPADVATASAAYSLRKVKDTYTGDAVRIRRASDNYEVNVAFDTNGAVSASSLIEQAELGLNRAGVILFDGVDDDIDVNSALLPTSDFTLTIKAFVTSYPSSDATIFGQGTVVGTGRTVLQIQTDGQAFAFLNGVGSFTTANTFNLNEINTIVFSRSGDDYSLTLNGGTAVTNNSSGSPQQVNSQIGDAYSGANFEGSIQSLTVGAVSWDGKQSSAESLGWTVNGSPELSVVVPTTLGGFLTEATPARNRTGSARYDTFTPNGVTGFTAITNNIAAGGFDIAGASGTDVQVSFDITLNSGQVSVKLRPDFETGSDVSNEETITTSGSKSFTLTSTADFKAMLFITASADFVVSNFSVNVPYNHDAYVHTWYDQSGSGNHATQNTTDDQPKIAEAGALLADGIDFDGSSSNLDMPSVISSVALASSFVVAKASNVSQTGIALALSRNNPDQRWYAPAFISGTSYFGYGDSASKINLGATDTNEHLFSAIADSSNATAFLDATSKGSTAVFTGTGLLTSGGIGAVNDTSFYEGSIKEIVVYNSDQTSNRFKIESNINNYYGIYTASHNGFVHTWYDQSGNSNHATQDTQEDDQPKIVEAGALIADGIDFTGGATAHHFNTTHVIGATTTIFGVVTSDAISDFFLDMRDGASDGAFIFSATGTVTNDTFRLQYNAVSLTGSSGATGEKLGSFLIKDGSQKIRVNGTEVASGTTAGAISVTTTTKIGTRSFGAPTSNWTGHMKEIIIYNSDESANFSDIESNIADYYGITLP